MDEHVAIVNRLLQENLIDYLNVSHGSSDNSHKIIGAMHENTGYELECSVPITRLTGLPTLVTGRFRTLKDANRVIERGEADMVSTTRAHIAEPDLVGKTVTGRAGSIRPCIGCNQGCVGGLAKGRIGCTVNPAAGNERRLAEHLITIARTPHRLLVVGGGFNAFAADPERVLTTHPDVHEAAVMACKVIVFRERFWICLKDNGGGTIINISSAAAGRASPNNGSYAVAKSGVNNLTRTLAVKLASHGIRVNAVAPGPIPTEVFMEFLQLEEAEIPELGKRFGIPLGRVGLPEDIAPVCVYLASDASSWMTGQVLDIRGGP